MTPEDVDTLIARVFNGVELWISGRKPVPFDLVVEWDGDRDEAWTATTRAEAMLALVALTDLRRAVRIALGWMPELGAENTDYVAVTRAWLRGEHVAWPFHPDRAHGAGARLVSLSQSEGDRITRDAEDVVRFYARHGVRHSRLGELHKEAVQQNMARAAETIRAASEAPSFLEIAAAVERCHAAM